MFTLNIQSDELYDDRKGEFIPGVNTSLQLEHSLLSISKWESKWHKPFLTQTDKTPDEIIDYIKCMTITKNVSEEVYDRISPEQFIALNEYIANPMTATTINDRSAKKGSSEIMTSELIYYYMFAQHIPIECEKWHINRLLTLIRVCGVKSQPPSKRSKNDILRENAARNAERKKRLNSKG